MNWGEMKPLSNCMPSVTSSSVAIVEPSSTVMTPARPTLPIASAISSPTEASWAETVATLAMSASPATSIALASSASLTAATALSMPRLRPVGLAPAVTLRRPSRTIAWASTVAVVVPSPATSLVFVATSLTSWAPRFSYGLSRSISLAMVTPSLVIVGGAELLVQHHVAAPRAEGDLDSVSERVDAVLQQVPRVIGEAQSLRHGLSKLPFAEQRKRALSLVPEQVRGNDNARR